MSAAAVFSAYLDKIEGPPSPKAMEDLAWDLLIDNKPERVERIADVMVTHWQNQQRANDSDHQFSFWLGIRSAACMVRIGKDSRASARRSGPTLRRRK